MSAPQTYLHEEGEEEEEHLDAPYPEDTATPSTVAVTLESGMVIANCPQPCYTKSSDGTRARITDFSWSLSPEVTQSLNYKKTQVASAVVNHPWKWLGLFLSVSVRKTTKIPVFLRPHVTFEVLLTMVGNRSFVLYTVGPSQSAKYWIFGLTNTI
jgi:hypothetical protein